MVTAGVAASGGLFTAVAFHQISLLGERGLSTVQAAGMSPQCVTSVSMALLAIGLAVGTIRTLEAAAFPRYFGTAHLGAIRGFVVAVGSAPPRSGRSCSPSSTTPSGPTARRCSARR